MENSCRVGKRVERVASRFFGHLVIGISIYLAVVCVLYVGVAVLLIRGVVADGNPWQYFQRNFYFSNYMNVWQGDEGCVEFDAQLIYKPRSGQCHFRNPEFDTILTFDEKGRVYDSIAHVPRAIAVVGDSHSMGWGEEDNETFAAVLQRESGIRVYNLAVASYGTYRELLRLENSGLMDIVDTVVIQYCDNDLSENLSFRLADGATAGAQFGAMFVSYSGLSVVGSTLEGVIRSIGGPLIAIKRKFDVPPDFAPHYDSLIRILSEFPALESKQIIVFYSNSYGKEFNNFPNGKDSRFENLYFADLKVPSEQYFKVDGHLTRAGHYTIAQGAMTRKRHTEEQIIAVLKDAQAGLGVQELCRKNGISDATFDKWRAKYAGLEVSDVKKLRQLEDENRRLKQLVAVNEIWR